MILPMYISFPDWIASLVVDYPNENIPRQFDEPHWRDFVDSIRDNATFSTVPRHEFFKGWRDWAIRFYEVLT